MDTEQIFLKPNIEAFDSNTQRIRRNLMVTSIVGIFMVLGAVNFDSDSNGFAGFKLTHVSIEWVHIFFLLALTYFFAHFVWAALDALRENRLRLTGIKIPKTTVGSYAADTTFEPNSDDARQSSIFSWWKGIKGYSTQLEQIVSSIEANYSNDKIEPAINVAKSHLEKINLKSSYIEMALLKYEKGFWEHQRSQLFRWFILDFGVPFLLSIVSFILILNEVVHECPWC